MFTILPEDFRSLKKSAAGTKTQNTFSKTFYKYLLLLLLLTTGFMAHSATYYLSPTGDNTSGDGSIGSPWFTLNKAWTVVKAGDTIYLRGGTYEYNSRQTLSGKNGSSGNYIHIFAYPNETPNLTKSDSFVTPSWPITLLYVQGDYTYWKGIEISGFSQAMDEVWSAFRFTNSDNNILEQINSHHNGHGGVITGSSTNNLVFNCDFHHNYDPLTANAYGDGDGFEFPYVDYGSVNTVRGCRFYYNSDDGIDLWSNDGYVTIENCWSWMNGYREDGVTPGGNGEGIKLGKTTADYSSKFLRTVRNNLSFYNRNDGITQNGANCKIYYYNNTLYANGYRGLEWFTASFANVVRNNISFSNSNSDYSGSISNATVDHNSYHSSWQSDGPTATSSDFVSVDDTTGVSGPRQADGSLPDIDFLKLKSGSGLIDAGTNVGIDYYGTAPDLGAYENQAEASKSSVIYTEDISICEGSSYQGWTTTGQYERTLTAASDGDSIVTTNLTVNPAEYTTEAITIYEGESYEGWSESGNYERTLTSSTGCDSIVTTNLTVIQTINATENIEICDGGSYEGWTTSGVYERILTAASGADSIITTNLTVHPVEYTTEDVTIYEGESYEGRAESGQYERTLTALTGCDSIVTTNLTVIQTISATENIEICDGGSYEGWTTSGVYERILTAASGADSIITTNLTVHPVKYTTEDVTIYEGESYEGRAESGQYERTLTALTGCDSIVTTNLTVIQTINATENIEICDGGSYEGWTTSGVYERILTAASGADSIITTNLTVHPVEYTTEDVTIYEGESYEGRAESGQYERTLTALTGCDSIVTTNLTVIQTINATENIEICEGESYEGWTISGEYQRVLTASSGTDSIVTTLLTVNPIKYSTEDITIYEGGNYLGWTQSGQYERTLTSSTGCDSIVTTNLTVTLNKYTTEDISICEGSSYEGWTTSGQYERLLIAATGADSIVTTNLTVNPVYTITEDITILKGENYFGWTEPGSYERILTTSTGCDSIITTNLVVMDHFIPVWWDENGQNHMNFYIADVRINGIELEVNDEIAIYDGDICVGVASLTTPINVSDENTYLFVKASQDDGSGNGFTSGNPISFRIWDYSKKIEVPVTGVTYKNDVAEWITTGNFVPSGTSVVEIVSVQEEQAVVTQSIALEKGWNIFSADVVPEVLGMDTVQDKIQSMGYLVKVQDEVGNTYERQNAKDGWINNIGEIQQTEGYKIRVKSDCVLDITGQPVALPLNIFLRKGSNLISFPYNGSVDAMEIIQPLIQTGILEKVQDERGNSIEYWGNSLGWVNGIGNFNAGEGYLIQVNSNGELPILEAYEKSGLLLANESDPEFFKVCFEGNGLDYMNINIVELNATHFRAGDEIAAFDGEICVGAVKLTETDLNNDAISIPVSAAEPDGKNGFTERDPIELRVWHINKSAVFQTQSEVVEGDMMYQKRASVFVQMTDQTTTGINDFESIKIDMYPNPAKSQVTVRFSTLPERETKIELTDMTGKQLMVREVQSNQEVLNIQSLPAGMYLVKIISGNNYKINKLIKN